MFLQTIPSLGYSLVLYGRALKFLKSIVPIGRFWVDRGSLLQYEDSLYIDTASISLLNPMNLINLASLILASQSVHGTNNRW